MIKIYGIKNCDSVRKARKFFKSHGIPHEFIDFRETPVTAETIDSWLQYSDINTLFNTRGTTYRTLKLKEKNLSDDEKCQWLAKENMLIKRPVVTFEKHVIIGYNESQYQNLLSKHT
ncbi:arsenate reductase [Sulfurovum lithotrophicum]|uniref:Arsenate reductase n=1 Tax=Sulfurovum lithotrophicum TaxID=206403 RepID=A0A7U4M2E0_9BACT|nr:arsenate reductase family protein [Sulfurovum lithotrophicum]AKF25459.1 arsenate reductase [Sulfurovum lithotrophicum]